MFHLFFVIALVVALIVPAASCFVCASRLRRSAILHGGLVKEEWDDEWIAAWDKNWCKWCFWVAGCGLAGLSVWLVGALLCEFLSASTGR